MVVSLTRGREHKPSPLNKGLLPKRVAKRLCCEHCVANTCFFDCVGNTVATTATKNTVFNTLILLSKLLLRD